MGSAPGLSPTAILVVSAWLGAPGLGLTFALFPRGALGAASRAALVLPLGYAAVVLIGFALALLHLFTLPTLSIGWILVTALAWGVGLRRRPERAPAPPPRDARDRSPWVPLAAAVVFLGYAAVRWTFAPIENLAPTPLRYWADGSEIADARGVPELTLQWGRLLAPILSKVFLNVFHGGAALLLGRAPLGPMGALLFVVSMGLAVGAFGLARELGLRLAAPLVVLALFANRVVGNTNLTADLNWSLAENWGRLVVLAAVMLAVRASRSRGDPPDPEGGPAASRAVPARLDAVIAAVLLGVAAGTHLVAAVVGLALISSHGVGRMVADRRIRAPLRATGIVLAVGAVIGGLALALPGGDVGFGGAAGDEAYAELGARLDLPDDVDPTLFLVVEGDLERVEAFAYGPADAVHAFASQVVGRNPRGESSPSAPWLVLPSVLGAVAFVVLMVRGDPDLRALAVTAALFAFVLLGTAVAFSLRYEVFALDTFGNRRLFNYVSIPYVLLAAGVVELLLRRVGEWSDGARAGRPRWRGPVVAVALTVVVGAALLPSAVDPRDRLVPRGQDVRTLAWIERNVPCEGRILADRRTLGTFQAMAHRAGVLEGMGPHIRPDVLARAIGEMLRAQAFFTDPAGGRGYLRIRGVAAIVLTEGYLAMGGWQRLVQEGPGELDTVPFLRRAFVTPTSTVYTVEGFVPDAGLPQVAAQPGYRC